MQLSLLSKPNSVFSVSSIKQILRTLLGKSGGPASVEESLKRGLKNVKPIEYNFNPPPQKLYETVVVIQGIDTLEYALELKNDGKIKKIYAGPNITLSTKSENFILQSKNIDKILVPSNWVKDFYISEAPELKDKTEVWPAGVEDTKEISDKKDGIIIYYKNAPKELLGFVKNVLDKNEVRWNLVEYGKHKQSDYFSHLKTSKGVIFLSPSESQGLALQEAWIRNVSTLVWDSGCMKNGILTWCGEKISAPYLTDESGIFFSSEEDFGEKLNTFLTKHFEPRKYCLENLTDEISTKKLLDIIKRDEKTY